MSDLADFSVIGSSYMGGEAGIELRCMKCGQWYVDIEYSDLAKLNDFAYEHQRMCKVRLYEARLATARYVADVEAKFGPIPQEAKYEAAKVIREIVGE